LVRRQRTKSNTVITVDFKGVEGKRTVIPEGDYTFRVEEVTKDVGDKGDYLAWVFVVEEGDRKGAKVWYNTSLTPQSLWNLRNLLETLGVEIPDGPLDIDLTELVDLAVGGTVVHEEWQGKDRARIADFFAVEEEPEEGTKEASTKDKADAKSSKKGNSLEKVKEEDVGEMDEDELADVVKKYKLDIDLDEHKTLRRKANIVIDKLEAANYLEK
jgi:hypothetical protein